MRALENLVRADFVRMSVDRERHRGSPGKDCCARQSLHPDGRIAAGLLIICDRSSPERAYLAVQDYALKTDDRDVVELLRCHARAGPTTSRRSVDDRSCQRWQACAGR